MMRTRIVLKGWLASLILLSSFAVAAVGDPGQTVRQTADKVLSEVTARRADLEADPSLIYPLVESTVVPHFDFRRMSQSAMGRFWRDASEQQRDQVINEFREMLVRTYATALLGYSGQQIEYLPVQLPPGETRVTVPTRITTGGAPPVPVNYRLNLNGDRWLVYDVVIDGVSLVTNYRSQFAAEVRRGGIDGLIASLADKNRRVGK